MMFGIAMILCFFLFWLYGQDIRRLDRRLTELEAWTRKNGEAGE